MGNDPRESEKKNSGNHLGKHTRGHGGLWKTLIFLMIVVFCAGCGKGDKNEPVYYDLVSSTEQVFGEDAPEGVRARLLRTMFYLDEPVQVWSVETGEKKDGKFLINILLRRTDGSTEVLLEGIDRQYAAIGFFVDEMGCSYISLGKEFVRLDNSGGVLWNVKLEDGVYFQDMCQLEDGTLVLSLLDNSLHKLALLDRDTGEISKLENLMLGQLSFKLGTGGNGLYLLDEDGVWTVDLKEEKREWMINFNGMAYRLDGEAGNFRVREGNGIEILKAGTTLETLELVDIGKNRIVLRLRTADAYINSWFLESIVSFNQNNGTYHVVLEQFNGDGHAEVFDFRNRTGIEIATGKGADLIMGSSVIGDIGNLLEKGVFEDLSPYLEQAGIREEDYFNAAFGCWRKEDAVYGVQPLISTAGGLMMDSSYFGGASEVTLEELLDVLLSMEDDGGIRTVLSSHFSQDMLLKYFLEGTEDFWGMIDREKGTCNFRCEVFYKIMEASERFGRENWTDKVNSLTENRNVGGLYFFQPVEELEGKTILDYFFDDGCHPKVNDNIIIGINSRSANKEGAWEFLNYLLDEENQRGINIQNVPANRAAYQAIVEREMEEGPIVDKVDQYGKVIGRSFKTMGTEEDRKLHDAGMTWDEILEKYRVTQEWADRLAAAVDDARYEPKDTEAMLDIISDEAQNYFAGAKSLDETADILGNRIGLYLQERMK